MAKELPIPSGFRLLIKVREVSNKTRGGIILTDESVEVNDAKFENGLLSIELEKIVPEEKKPKEIKIK